MAVDHIDDLIAQVHTAGAGALPCGVALETLRAMTGARMVTLHGLHKASRSVAFSFEVGDLPAQAALDFIRKYHQIEPRTPLLVHSPVVHCRDGLLCGPDPHSDAELLTALRSLRLGGGAYLGQGQVAPTERAVLRLACKQGDWLGVHCHALRATQVMGAFGHSDLALVWLHDPETIATPDPFIVAALWDLSPAEAQVMVGLGQGWSAQELADQRGVSLATVRSQIQSTLRKTGAPNQAALVHMLSDMPSFLT